jgi:hypothetical protein
MRKTGVQQQIDGDIKSIKNILLITLEMSSISSIFCLPPPLIFASLGVRPRSLSSTYSSK